MPKRTDIESILVIGSGPIVIGQACEFDYSGTQACRVLRAEGYRVILVNSNPATIMTDPELADATYIEPLDLDTLTRVIEKERPDALLPTLGGQTALNLAIAAAEAGVLDRFGVELIGAGVEAIHTAEDRRRFKAAMIEIGLSVPKSGIAYSLEEALAVGEEIGYPLICRPFVHPRRRRHRLRRRRRRNWKWWRPTASPPARWGRSSSSSRSPAGRNTSSRSCATAPTTPSWCARSRTSTRWAPTPATRSPSPRPRR